MTKKFIPRLLVLAMAFAVFGVWHFASADDITTETSVSNVAPTFTAGPSDGGSDTTAPTYAGDNVTFTATANDTNGDDYYLIICDAAGVSPGNDAAPTCTGGSAWATSSATTDSTEATATYLAAYADDGDQAWWAYVCDKLPTASGPGCSSASQGSGVTGSPFHVDTHIPSFTVTPTDSSDGTTPTDEGDNVTFAATATDARGDQWYLAVCTTNSVTPGSDAPPTCAAGETLCVTSTAVNSGVQQSCTWDTTDETAESINWYAFACDKNTVAGGGKCSSADTTNSPLKVNHHPVIGTVTINDGTGSIEPGETVTFTVAVTDTDTDTTADTIDMYVCDQAGFTPGTGCTATHTICKTNSGVASGGNASCASDDTDNDLVGYVLNDIPEVHHGNGGEPALGVYIYLDDNHDFEDDGTNNSQSYNVTDVVPTYVSYSITTSDPISIGVDSSTTVNFTFRSNDDNGWDDITSARGVFFDDTATAGTCIGTDNENNCYEDTSCSLSQFDSTDADAACSVTVWFNANASSNWEVAGRPTDGNGETTFADSTAEDFVINATQGLGVVMKSGTTIAYGTVAIGGTSTYTDARVTRFRNLANVILDIKVQGTDMAGTPSGSIVKGQQEWYYGDADFTYGNGYDLIADSSSATTAATGCIDRDMAIRTNHAPHLCEDDATTCTVTTQSVDCSGIGSETCVANGTDEFSTWKIEIPTDTLAGSYSGTNTFAASSSSTCTDSP